MPRVKINEDGIENIDYVVCKICGEKFGAITIAHLKKHKISMENYKKEYNLKNVRIIKNKQNIYEEKLENIDYVVCQICGKKMRTLSKHIKKHGLKVNFYLLSFPNSLICCKQLSEERSKKFQGDKNPRFKKPLLNIWIKKYGQEKAEEIAKNYSFKMFQSTSGEQNGMYGRKVLDIWIEKYGKEEALDKFENRYRDYSIKFSGKNNPMYGKSRPSIKGCLYKKIFFKSTWEAIFAYDLDLKNIKWEYEKYRICLEEGNTYLPDFVLYNDKKIVKIVEIKGYKDGSERFPKLLQKCCLVPVELYDEDRLKEEDVFRHKNKLKKINKNKFIVEV